MANRVCEVIKPDKPDINVSQGSVATLVSGIFNVNFIANFLTSQPVKEL